jgi:hypothetical protein
MKESFIDKNPVLVTHDEAAEVAKPGESAFYFPSFAVTAQPTSIVEGGFGTIVSMRGDQKHPILEQALAQRIAVVGAVGNDALWLLGTDLDALEGRFAERYFRRAGAGKLTSQRNTLAVDHHHPLRSLSAFGFSDREAPFLAGAKLPSKKLSLQSSFPRSSSSRRNALQISSHTPRSSHLRSRLQQVAAEGYSLGRSRHLAPVLRTQRMPSSTRRLSAQGRPLLRVFGNKGAMRFHCSSLRNVSIPSFAPHPLYKVQTFLSVASKNF